MTNYLKSEKKFVNPYHFIPLDEHCNKGFDYLEQRKEKGNLTGWLECRLKTLSPVFIPNTSNVHEEKGEKHSDVFPKPAPKDGKKITVNSYDFFSYTDLSKLKGKELEAPKQPVIPGSEIRGVIRSAFEAVTNSCLSTIDDEQPLYKRVQSPARPGRLVYDRAKNQWCLYSCVRYRLPKKYVKISSNNEIFINGEKYTEGEEVHVLINYKNFKVVKIAKKPGNRFKQGFLHIGEYNENKNYESVFLYRKDKRTNRDEVINLSDYLVPKMLNNLIENVLLYKDKANKTEGHHQYRHIDKSFGEIKSISSLVNRFEEHDITFAEFSRILQKEYKSVFKYLDGALVNSVRYGNSHYLSPAMIGREVFYHKLTGLVGTYKPCQAIDKLCPACVLFGIAGRDGAVASRVRFTDAHVGETLENQAAYYDEVRILKELASPKLSATEFYLEKNPDYADLWNYDYAVNWRSHRYGIPGFKPKIKGRKFYWHHKNPNPYVDKEKESDPDFVSDRNVAIRALKKENTFKFKVYFNNITASELKKLLWILEIGGKKEHGHKIGMGKPLGMGSVKISVDQVCIRELALDQKNSTIKYNPQDSLEQYKDFVSMNHGDLGCSELVWNNFLTITKLEPSFEPIEYPTIEDKPENYLWFVANKQISGTGTKPVIEQMLPPIDSPWLKKYKEKKAG